MKTRLLLAIVCAIVFAGPAPAQSPGGKSGDKKEKAPRSAPEQAYDDFAKLVGDNAAKKDGVHFKKIITAGITYLTQYPADRRAVDAVKALGEYASNALRDKALAPQRAVYISTLKYDLLDARIKAETDEQKMALAALDAAAADAEIRENRNRGNLDTLREKIDVLAAMEGSGRFLADRERTYYQAMADVVSQGKADEYAKSLLDHKEKSVATMARNELDQSERRTQPYGLKFAALDGKEVDFEKLRGKAVAVYFWSTTNNNSTKNWDALRTVHGTYKKKGMELVTVSFDKADDREKVMAYVKSNVDWPVHFDGKGNKNEEWAKLGVTGAPRLVVFDTKGLMLSNNVSVSQLETAVKQVLKIK